MTKIYLDYAATTPLDPAVLETMIPFLKDYFGNPSSLHSWGQKARQAVENSRQQVADVLSCHKEEIIFTSCATEANNLALKGLIEATKGKHIIISPTEHHCVLDTTKHLQKNGVKVTWLKTDKYGLVNLNNLKESIRKETVLISIMYVNNEVGTIQSISEIGKLIKAINRSRKIKRLPKIYFHTDAVQAIQYLNCNVNYLGVDFLSLSAHKFYGPKGVGALFVRKNTPLVRQQDGGEQEFNLRAGTENVAGIVGLGRAIKKANNHKQMISQKINKLSKYLIKKVLSSVKDVQLTGHPIKRAPHIASFIIKGVEGESLLLMLNEKGIGASSGSACTSGNLEPSHVLTSMGIPPIDSHGSLRLSLGKNITKKDIDYLIKVLPNIVNHLRQMSPLS